MAMSLNGIIATEDNKEDFLSHDNWNEFVKIAQKTGCLIWGRKTYEIVKTWDESYLKPLKNIVKVILSGNSDLNLDEGFIKSSSPKDALEILEGKGFKECILTGGSTNNSSFAKLGLIDEVVVDVEGVVIGKGIPLFKQDDFELKLQLIESIQVSKNIVQLRYKVMK